MLLAIILIGRTRGFTAYIRTSSIRVSQFFYLIVYYFCVVVVFISNRLLLFLLKLEQSKTYIFNSFNLLFDLFCLLEVILINSLFLFDLQHSKLIESIFVELSSLQVFASLGTKSCRKILFRSKLLSENNKAYDSYLIKDIVIINIVCVKSQSHRKRSNIAYLYGS